MNNVVSARATHLHLSRFYRLALVCAALLAAAPAPIRAQQAEIDALASGFAERIAESKKPRINKVLVADFLLRKGDVTKLGRIWADEFSKDLASAAQGFQVVDRDRLHAILTERKFSPAVVRDDDMARWLAELAGAQAIVRGYIEPSGDSLTLSIAMLWTERRGERIEAEVNLPKAKEWEALLGKDVVPVDEAVPSGPTPVYKVGVGGVSFPECQSCPPPGYTKEARQKKLEGTVALRVMITPEGRATNIRIFKPKPYGMTEKAIEAVKAWRFKPARSRDGTPVPVEIVIEVTFRLM